ncbi:MAG TPA: hypothetical protein VGV14_10410 [Rhodanobacter sp.]|nr:hypothetical protein [Rhodanobacter sp.]
MSDRVFSGGDGPVPGSMELPTYAHRHHLAQRHCTRFTPAESPAHGGNTMKVCFLTTLAFCAGLIGFGCTAAPAGVSQTEVPNDVRALVTPTDTLLAYKPADLYGDGTQAAVIVIRHQLSGKSDYDFDKNPCELVVLRRENGKLVEADRSTKAVDCTYNDIARNAPAMALNDNLTATPASIVYINQKDKGDSTFYFAWSKEKNTWYLQRATASNPNGSSVAASVSASYPKDFAWTLMSSVDPDAMAEILEKQGKTNE